MEYGRKPAWAAHHELTDTMPGLANKPELDSTLDSIHVERLDSRALDSILYNTLFSREEIFAKIEFEIFSRKLNLRYFREKIFSRIYYSRENIFPRKYPPAKISCRENFLSRRFPLAKISSHENIFPRIVSVSQMCRLVTLGFAVYYSITERPLPN